MLQKTKGIVIRNVKYSETSLISKIYTEQFGIQSYLVPGVRSKSGSIKAAQLMPLNLLEMVVYHKPNSKLQRLKELRCEPHLSEIHFDIVKSSIAMFILEVLNKTLTEEQADPQVFNFLYNMVQVLDVQKENLANFPPFFLLKYSKFLGFYPRGKFSDKTQYFDLNEGEFASAMSGGEFVLSPSGSKCLSDLLECGQNDFFELKIPLNERHELLDNLITYFEIHGLHSLKLKSQLVLREVFR